MGNWRETILREFDRPWPLILASDPDNLLLDEAIVAALRQQKIEMMEADDPVAFRYLYEKKYRERVADRQVSLLVRTCGNAEDLPYDLLKQGHLVTFRLSDLFAGLSAAVVRQLDGEALDVLYAAYQEYLLPSFRLGREQWFTDDQTCDFILRRVYRVAPETLQDEVSLIRFFLSLHLQQHRLPKVLQAYLLRTWKDISTLNHLPLNEWLVSPAAFYRDLQLRWQTYVRSKEKNILHVHERSGEYSCASVVEPFEHPEIQRLLDNLFLEGKLKPVEVDSLHGLPDSVLVGVRTNPQDEAVRRVEKLLAAVSSALDSVERYHDWLKIARLYGEIKILQLARQDVLSDRYTEGLRLLAQELNRKFETWMMGHFGTLANLPYFPQPAMVHHVPHFLAAGHRYRTALIVLDGMGVVQWLQIRQALQSRMPQLIFDEQMVFAWVPTMTSISRQALLSSEIPLYFADTLTRTDREAARWTLFWENRGLSRKHVGFLKGLGQAETPELDALLHSQKRVAALVVDVVDRLMHSAIQGEQSLYLELDLWLRKGYLANLLSALLQAGYDVYLASDHGNVESQGIGPLREGVLAETRGERVRIYIDERLRDQMVSEVGGIKWPGFGLPDDMYIMLAKYGQAFVQHGQVVLSHGGISLEEVIVPFVRVRWREES